MFKTFYLTYSDYELKSGNGRVFDETFPDQTFDDVVNDIMRGDREYVISVYRIAPGEAPEDVSKAIAQAILKRLWEDETCSTTALRYLGAQGIWIESEAAE